VNLITIFYYSLLGTIRSSRLIGASIASVFLFISIYMSVILLRSFLPEGLTTYLLMMVAILDFVIKYNFPGMFSELVSNLLIVTLRPRLIARFIVFNIFFFYYNLVALSTIAIGNNVEFVLIACSIMIVNHIIVYILKTENIFRIESIGLLIFGGVINLVLINFNLSASFIALLLCLIIVTFYTYLTRSLYVKR
jgi:hypothetical protein